MASKKSIARVYAWHLMWSGGSCEMEECKCPKGRLHFADEGPWVPSVDRWPIPGRLGGTYNLDNVRLSHQTCNKVDGGKVGGTSRSEAKVKACRENFMKVDRHNQPNHVDNLSQNDRVRGGDIGRCRRWYINRNLPCICEAHIS